MAGFLMTLLSITGVFLMFIILLQRGRGGGLAGAFGGAGGQSAFGTRAGDVFTRITVGLVVIWVILAGATGFAMRSQNSKFVPGTDVEKDPPEVTRAGGKLIEEPKEKSKDEGAASDDSGQKSTGDKSADGKPGDDKASSDKPDAEKPDSDKPDSKKPDAEKPAAEKPSDEKSSTDEPKKSKAGDEPAKESPEGESKDAKKPDAPKPATPKEE